MMFVVIVHTQENGKDISAAYGIFHTEHEAKIWALDMVEGITKFDWVVSKIYSPTSGR